MLLPRLLVFQVPTSHRETHEAGIDISCESSHLLVVHLVGHLVKGGAEPPTSSSPTAEPSHLVKEVNLRT